MESDQRARGMFGSLRKLCDAGVGLVQNRVELFAVELREEKARQVRTFLWAAAVVFLGMMTATLVTVTIAVAFWDTARLPVLVVLSLIYGLASIGTGLVLRNRLARERLPFADTVSELKKDREWVQASKSESSKSGNGP